MHNASMSDSTPILRTGFATAPEDIAAAQRLRYTVFVEELGAVASGADHDARLEADRVDPFAHHLVLRDDSRALGDQIIGAYRLLDVQGATAAGGFYSQSEFDLAPLHISGRRILELSRSCLHPDYRNGRGLLRMWGALHQYCTQHGIEVLFGVASFRGADPEAHIEALSFLHHHHLAPLPLRLNSTQPQTMQLRAPEDIDPLRAKRSVPSLIKGYLRMGGKIGQGVYVDHDFNTTDVCLVLNIEDMSQVAAAKMLNNR